MIKSWFSEDIKNYYLQAILSKLKKKETDTIKFLPGKEIDYKTLLTGTREEVKNVPGILDYIGVGRCAIKKTGYSQADYLLALNESFYKDIEYEKNGTKMEFKYDSSSAVVANLSGKRVVKGDMYPFFKYYMDIIYRRIPRIPKNYKDFLHLVTNRVETNNNYISKLINYNLINNDMRHKLLDSLGIKCCPYCNRQYITSWYDDKGRVHSTADLDHFYQKSTYPLFALSLFNFVPSCQICNSRMKGSDETETLYPYEEGMDEFHFRCMPKDSGYDDLVDLWLANKTNDPNKLCDLYKLQLVDESDDYTDIEHIERINGSRKVFCLDEVYQTHVDAAINEMLKIRIYYSGDYAEYACKTLEELGIGKDDENVIYNKDKNRFSESEMRDIILGFVYNGQDKLDQPLGKMMSDILEHEMSLKKSYSEDETR